MKRSFVSRLSGLVVRKAKRLIGYQRVLFFWVPSVSDFPGRGKVVQVEISQLEKWHLEGNAASLNLKEVAARIKDGHLLFALIMEKQPVTFGWVSRTDEMGIDELGAICHFSFQPTIIWDCVTEPNFRGLGFYTKFLSELRMLFADRKLVIYATATNAASLSGIRSAGFETFASIVRTRIYTHIFYRSPDSATLTLRYMGTA